MRGLGILLFVLMGMVGSVRSQNSCPASNSPDKPLCILRQPQPIFSDEAKKHLQGAVLLSVEFLSNGTIGAVTWVNKYAPHASELVMSGIVGACIKAAKGIEFEPEKKKGALITVSKKVEYDLIVL